MGPDVPDNEENDKLCLCPACPTYKKSNLTSNLFCARGKAKEKAISAGCLCPSCSVFMKYKLNQMYFCMKGKSSEIQQ